jgi:hypothetical protein
VSAWKLKLANVIMSFLTMAAVFPAVGVNWMHVSSLGDTEDSDLRRIHSVREHFVACVELNQLERAADGRRRHPQVGRRKLTSTRMVDFETLVARKPNLSLVHTKLLIRGDVALRVALTGSAAPKQVARPPVSPASPDNATSQTTFMAVDRGQPDARARRPAQGTFTCRKGINDVHGAPNLRDLLHCACSPYSSPPAPPPSPSPAPLTNLLHCVHPIPPLFLFPQQRLDKKTSDGEVSAHFVRCNDNLAMNGGPAKGKKKEERVKVLKDFYLQFCKDKNLCLLDAPCFSVTPAANQRTPKSVARAQQEAIALTPIAETPLLRRPLAAIAKFIGKGLLDRHLTSEKINPDTSQW